VPLVSKPFAFACRAERLARTGTGPAGTVIGPSSEAESVGPAADPGEEMALGVSDKIDGVHVFDTALIHISVCD
jgi:hypothetical protein